MATVKWTAEAVLWLEEIYEHIAADNAHAAAETVRGIYKRAQSLTESPLIGKRYENSERHVRILLYSHYRITYLVKDLESIEILGVFHGALDIDKYQL